MGSSLVDMGAKIVMAEWARPYVKEPSMGATPLQDTGRISPLVWWGYVSIREYPATIV